MVLSYFLATIEAVATSNLVHNLGLGSSLSETTFRTKTGESGLGGHPKIWDPLLISANVETSKFKFGTQQEFGFTLLKATFRNEGGGV